MQADVDLTSCDREPIHVPGSIQPHGVMLVFDSGGKLYSASENASRLLSLTLEPRQALDDWIGNETIRQVVVNALAGTGRGVPQSLHLAGTAWDVSHHQSGAFTVIEFEPRPIDAAELTTFAIHAQEALAKLQAASTLAELLETATGEIRRLTGFDRVMCYQFRHDDSGTVITEEREEHLEPFLGLRYPATDIPAQARRLYTLNPLRFIVDIDATPSALVPDVGSNSQEPLDLSKSILRSVSPIHVEYLKNMDVKASMSVSIVVAGRLWGLFACHHYSSTKLIPHAVRVACQLLSSIVSVLVERFLSTAHQESMEQFHTQRIALVEEVRTGDDLLSSLIRSTEITKIVQSDGAAVVLEGRIVTTGSVPPLEKIRKLLEIWDSSLTEGIAHSYQLSRDYSDLADLKGVAGALGIRYSSEQGGWVLWFRQEEIESVRWGGNPEKVYSAGPNGPRLTPRGSFSEYVEHTRHRAQPWSAAELEAASRLRVDLQAISLARLSELERARDLLVAALSHDLRNPLNAIHLSAQLLQEGVVGYGDVGSRIRNSSNRMKLLIDHMLDFSRIQSGMLLGVKPVEIEIEPITKKIIEESSSAYPGLPISVTSNVVGTGHVDAERYAQVLSNLLSNARHHGEPGAPVTVELSGGGPEHVTLRVKNIGPEISESIQKQLFKPYKQTTFTSETNRRGLGLGLYIIRQILVEHNGTVELEPYEGAIVFRAVFPAKPG